MKVKLSAEQQSGGENLMGAGDKDLRALRDELIRQVEDGVIEPDDAEKRAAEAGLPPFETTPLSDHFDPMTLSSWTLPMALAWIMWRTPGMVRESWDDYLQECRQWRRIPGRGHRLQPHDKASVSSVQLDEHLQDALDPPDRPRRQKDFDVARAELWRLLTAGAVRATAVDALTDKRCSIEPAEWQDGEFLSSRDTLSVGVLADPHRYEEIRVPAQAITNIWLPRCDPAMEFPEVVVPEGGGHMTLFSVAHWIASRGGAERDRLNLEIWQTAYQQLLGLIVAGKVGVVGTRSADGVSEVIDPVEFSDCIISQPFGCQDDTLLFGTVLVLVSTPNVSGGTADGGDSLRNRHGPRWIRLRIAKADVAKLWPFVLDAASYRTGERGRPSPKGPVMDEYKRRRERGEMGQNQSVDAKELALWWVVKHPNARPVQPKTIAKYIRELHRQEALSGHE